MDKLVHHGVKGMKWGVRKSKSFTYNPNYSDQQRKRDRNVYSKGAEKRINKRMNKGESISSARSREAERINSARSRGRLMGQAGRGIGGAVGAIGGAYLTNKAMQIGSKYVKDPTLKAAMNTPEIRIAASVAIGSGAAAVTSQLAANGGRSLGMLTGGYSPKKYR